MAYQLHVSPAANRDIKRLDEKARQTVRDALVALTTDPRPPGCRKLVGWQHRYRLRIGRWRIIYDAFDGENVLVVLRIVPRTETTYRRL